MKPAPDASLVSTTYPLIDAGHDTWFTSRIRKLIRLQLVYTCAGQALKVEWMKICDESKQHHYHRQRKFRAALCEHLFSPPRASTWRI